MKKLTLLLNCLLFFSFSFSQKVYWQQQVNFTIDVTLNDTLHTLDADLSMEYFNNSPDTLHFIWIHLWPNAYKNDKTAFSEQLLQNGRTDFYFSNEEDRGYINRLNFTVDNSITETKDHPQHQDIVKLILAKPLAPNQHVTIQTPFHVKLPKYFSRSGFIGNTFSITQWFPKPAVYDAKGWHEIPYLDQGEFYSEFGNYKVSIHVPEEYVVAASGKHVSEKTLSGMKEYIFEQNNIHDFAWFADKHFEVLHDTIQLKDHVVDAYAYYNSNNKKQWQNSMLFIKRAITTKSNWIGTYPYETVSVVEKPGSNDGGMEYPTITLVSPGGSDKDLDNVIYHEIGHNWFYGILATNERTYPWMDEGLNSFYDKRYEYLYYNEERSSSKKKSFLSNKLPENYETLSLRHLYNTHQDQPINNTSENFNSINYNLIAYIKTAQWLKQIEKDYGRVTFDSMMQHYYTEWEFKHPQPEDFIAFLKQQPGAEKYIQQLNKKGALQKNPSKKIKATFLFNLKETDKYNYISFAPVIGLNKYDKVMPGIIIHDYSIPAPAFKFFVMPMYSTGSSALKGMGRLSYTFYPSKNNSRLEVSIAGSSFTAATYRDSTGKINPLSFSKVVPAIRYTFSKKATGSRITFIQAKTYLINETIINFFRDTIAQKYIISYPEESRYVNQLLFSVADNRKLYPYQFEVMAEQGKDFVRTTLTTNYFFNYAKGGGMNVRFFAGKFFYTTDKTFLKQFQTDRYHLNLTGPRGYEDYTYSDYFFGRNEFEKFPSQQLMIRDGAFKVGTDLLNDKVGKTDDWLSAMNITTDIPKKINPLSILPVKLPLKVFADIGTYAEAWKKDAPTGKFLYDAGIQLQIFKVLNIYWPILYSKVYRDYYTSTITEKKFSRTLSFSIDIRNLGLQKLVPQILY